MNKVVVITGASKGIGKAMVEQFKDSGYQVAACARHVPQESRADYFAACDISDKSQVKEFLQQVKSRFDHIDVLINNAGLTGENSMTDEDDQLWHQIIDINLHGTYYMSKLALPLLSSHSTVINIASVLALIGVPDNIAYCAAKHGVLGFSRALAEYLKPKNIAVYAICPSWVDTDMAASRAKEMGVTTADLAMTMPKGKMIAPEEIAVQAILLAEGEHAYKSGDAVVMEGA